MRHAYFPHTGVISLVGLTAAGHALQVAAVDRRGFVGVPIVLGTHATAHDIVVHVPGEAHRIRAEHLITHYQQRPYLRRTSLGWVQGHVAAIGQSVICHRFHTLRQRLCRWLLISAESVDATTIPVTQECLAQILGSPRSTVSAAAIQLQDRGVIRLRHGKVQIVDRLALEASACECHSTEDLLMTKS